MARRAYFQVANEGGTVRIFPTLEAAVEFAEEFLLSSTENYLEIFEVKEAACVSRDVSFSLHVYE